MSVTARDIKSIHYATDRAVEDEPLAVGRLRHGEGAERHGQYTVGPLVRHGVELAVQLPHRDRLGVDDRVLNLDTQTRISQ